MQCAQLLRNGPLYYVIYKIVQSFIQFIFSTGFLHFTYNYGSIFNKTFVLFGCQDADYGSHAEYLRSIIIYTESIFAKFGIYGIGYRLKYVQVALLNKI